MVITSEKKHTIFQKETRNEWILTWSTLKLCWIFYDVLETCVIHLFLVVCCNCSISRAAVCNARPQHKPGTCASCRTGECIQGSVFAQTNKNGCNYRLLSTCLEDSLHLASHCKTKTIPDSTILWTSTLPATNFHKPSFISKGSFCSCTSGMEWWGNLTDRNVVWHKPCTSGFSDILWLCLARLGFGVVFGHGAFAWIRSVQRLYATSVRLGGVSSRVPCVCVVSCCFVALLGRIYFLALYCVMRCQTYSPTTVDGNHGNLFFNRSGCQIAIMI